MASPIEEELRELLDLEELLQLVNRFGGTPLYVPSHPKLDSELVDAIGIDAAKRLSPRFAPDYINVPVARVLKAQHLRANGCSNTMIAVRLGIGLGGVERLFRREGDGPAELKWLPTHFEDPWIATIGPAAFARLAAAYGGTRVYLYEMPDLSSPIALLIGEEAFMTLYERHPLGWQFVPRALRRVVKHHLSQGHTPAKIATVLKLDIAEVEQFAASLAG